MKLIIFLVSILVLATYAFSLEPSPSIVIVPNNLSNTTNQQGQNPPGQTQGAPAGGGGGGALPLINTTNNSNIYGNQTGCTSQNCTQINQTQEQISQQLPRPTTTYPIKVESNKLLLLTISILILAIFLILAAFLIISKRKRKKHTSSKPL